MKTEAPGNPAPDLRLALMLNVLLPGLGHAMTGRVMKGMLFMAAFLGCFIGIVSLFFFGYLEYFQFATGDVMNHPDADLNPFNLPWMIGLGILALVIYFASFAGIARSR